MREGDVLHIGTHPPGLIVAFRGLLALCRAAPAATEWVLASEPGSVRASFAAIKETAGPSSTPLDSIDRAVLWLATLLAQAFAAMTVFPLFGLLRRTCTPRASWLAVAFWPAVPAVALFLPKSDALFPFFAALILWLWLSGLDQRSHARCFLAGLTLWLSLFLSPAFLPVAFLTACVTLWSCLFRAGDSSFAPSFGERSLTAPFVSGSIGFALPIVLLWLLARLNLMTIWSLNLRNHAAFYGQFQRTYGKWLLINPLEFAVAAGVPLVLAATYSGLRQYRTQGMAACGPVVGFLATWGILWLSGKNSGEAARLWIFLTPFLVWIAGPAFDPVPGPPADPARNPPLTTATGRLALALQLAVCGAIVMRVIGFHYQ
jgi:hypothetical protein